MGRKLFVLSALLILLLPVLLSPFGTDIRTYRSDAQTASFREDPLGYAADHLALRTAAITLRSRLLGLIGESGSDQVIRGRDGFLFFAESLHTEPLTPTELTSLTEKLQSLEQALFAAVQEYSPRFRVRSRNMTVRGVEWIVELRTKQPEQLMARVGAIEGLDSVNLLSHDGEVRF
jgi:hypothetical protein